LIVEDGVPPEWERGIVDLEQSLVHAGHAVLRTRPNSWLEVDADAYLISCDRAEEYRPILEGCASVAPVRLSRTLLLGCNLQWTDEPSGLPRLLDAFPLAGTFGSMALIEWREAPSPFVGLKRLMDALQTNAFKGYSTEHYCAWFGARGKTLAEFLSSYLQALLASLDRVAPT
jgi:hypothetical protein